MGYGSWWVTDLVQSQGPAALVSWIVVVIGSIVLHELAHGWAAIRLGDDTPRWTGHMTWNPVVHLGTMSLVVFALIGIAWGAMPVDPSRLRGRWGAALVALAGPAMNFVLGVIGVVLMVLFARFGGAVAQPMNDNLAYFFSAMAFLNFVLMIFNLLPVYPLDGGRILGEIHPPFAAFAQSENGQWVMLGGFMLAFFFAKDFIFGAAMFVVELIASPLIALLS